MNQAAIEIEQQKKKTILEIQKVLEENKRMMELVLAYTPYSGEYEPLEKFKQIADQLQNV